MACEKYYTHLGAKDRPRDSIAATTNPVLLCKLNHKIWEYKRHTPLELIEHIEKQMAKHDVSAITSWMAHYHTPPTLD